MRCRTRHAGGCRGGRIHTAAKVVAGGPVPSPVPLWAYYTTGARALCGPVETSAVAAVYDASGGCVSFLTSLEADLVLAPNTAFRPFFSINNTVDANSILNFQRSSVTAGRGMAFFREDTAHAAHFSIQFTQPVVDGDRNFIAWFDTAVGTTGTVKVKVNETALNNLGDYDRTMVLLQDYYSPAGSTRGPTPDVFSPLGWVYWHISVAADLTSISTELAAASAAAPDPMTEYLFVLGVLVAEGFEGDIIYAQAFAEGRGADYGAAATVAGVTDYTLPGVPP